MHHRTQSNWANARLAKGTATYRNSFLCDWKLEGTSLDYWDIPTLCNHLEARSLSSVFSVVESETSLTSDSVKNRNWYGFFPSINQSELRMRDVVK